MTMMTTTNFSEEKYGFLARIFTNDYRKATVIIWSLRSRDSKICCIYFKNEVVNCVEFLQADSDAIIFGNTFLSQTLFKKRSKVPIF